MRSAPHAAQFAMSRRDKARSKRRSRSGDRSTANFSDFLNRGFSLRGSKGSAASMADLSMDAGSPGVLKVYGESLQAGAAYKSILVAPCSTASEVVAEVLERYGVSRRMADQFELCDAVGQLSGGRKAKDGLSIFTEEYHRPLAPGEHVVTVQCLWRAAPGLNRRLEIRRRLVQDDSNACSDYHSDNETRGINENARRWARAKLPSEVRHSMFLSTRCTPESCDTGSQTSQPSPPPRQLRHHMPLGPHLLLLRGLDSKADRLAYELGDSNIVGSDHSCDIVLPQTECIAAEHCIIHAVEPRDAGSRCVFRVEPCALTTEPTSLNAVTINGRAIRVPTALEPGDLLGIGKQYVFLFKTGSDHDLPLTWLPKSRRLPTSSSSFRFSRATSFRNRRSSEISLLATRPDSTASNRFAAPLSQVRYDLMVGQLLDGEQDAPKVCPEFAAALLLMLIQHMASDADMKEELQWQCSERVCSLCQKAQITTGQVGLLESMQPVIGILQACGITFECFLHFKNVSDALQEHTKEWKLFFESLAIQTLDDAVKCLAEVRT